MRSRCYACSSYARSKQTNRRGKPVSGQQDNLSKTHRHSNMTVEQLQQYAYLLAEKADILGPHYVAAQALWVERELDIIEGRA